MNAMIRHALDPDQLRTDIEKQDARWFAKAATRTRRFVRLGAFDEKSSIWSTAKSAFMLLQQNKCAFCERPFTGPEESRIEMDLEHYRPKSAVAMWKPPAGVRPYPSLTGDASATGYYWLAYQTGNYAAACKICNSDHKGAYFPIAGTRCGDPHDAAALAAEQPYLVYPIGTSDEDPEDLITFTGTVAHPVAADGLRHARGALIIDFFGLNTRDQLHIQRAEIIERFGKALIAVADGHAEAADHTYIAQIRNPIIPHAACLRAFKRRWDEDQQGARRLFDACRNMLATRLLDPTAAGLGVGFP
jgi:hypothetical protein